VNALLGSVDQGRRELKTTFALSKNWCRAKKTSQKHIFQDKSREIWIFHEQRSGELSITTWVSNASNDAVLRNWPLQIIKLDWYNQDNAKLKRFSASVLSDFLHWRQIIYSAWQRSFTASLSDFVRPSVVHQMNFQPVAYDLCSMEISKLGHTELIFVDSGANIIEMAC